VNKLIVILLALGGSLVSVAEPPRAFQRPETTRRYLHGPLSERLLVNFREGKVILGEVVHRDDWSLPYEQNVSHGIWLVRGEADEPFDLQEARLMSDADGTPVHGQSWREYGLEAVFESCAPFGRKPTAQVRLTVANRGTERLERKIGFLVRTAPECKLVFGAPDIYDIYRPRVWDWKVQPVTFAPDGANVLRDGDRFVCWDDRAGLTWDAKAGLLSLRVALAPGERKTIQLTVGKGETVTPDYEAVVKAVRADWKKELSRVSDRTPLVRRLIAQILQCFARPTEGDFVVPRQGGLQRFVWPGDEVQVVDALSIYGYGDYARMTIDFYFRLAKPDGMIGPFGNPWASDTANCLDAFARHCLTSNDAEYWRKYYPKALAAFRWIRAKRSETANATGSVVPGLFPPLKSTDLGQGFQHWGMTDLVNERALGVFAEAAKRFGAAEAGEIESEWKAYRAVIVRVLDRWRKASEGKDTLFIPLAADGSNEQKYRDERFFYLHPGAFAEGGYLDERDMLRLRAWLLREGFAHPNGLYMCNRSECPGMTTHVWYTTWSEMQWASGWRRVGRRDLSRQALDALLACSVTAEGYVGERMNDQMPWFYPWSPNASGSGRILKMLAAEGLDREHK